MTRVASNLDETAEIVKGRRRRNGATGNTRIAPFFITLPDGRRKRIPIGPLTRKATGIAKPLPGKEIPPGKDYRDLYEEAICEKHGVRK